MMKRASRQQISEANGEAGAREYGVWRRWKWKLLPAFANSGGHMQVLMMSSLLVSYVASGLSEAGSSTVAPIAVGV